MRYRYNYQVPVFIILYIQIPSSVINDETSPEPVIGSKVARLKQLPVFILKHSLRCWSSFEEDRWREAHNSFTFVNLVNTLVYHTRVLNPLRVDTQQARREHIYLHVSPRVQRISDYMLVIISSQLPCINSWYEFKRNSGPVE